MRAAWTLDRADLLRRADRALHPERYERPHAGTPSGMDHPEVVKALYTVLRKLGALEDHEIPETVLGLLEETPVHVESSEPVQIEEQSPDSFHLAHDYRHFWNTLADMGLPVSEEDASEAEAELSSGDWVLWLNPHSDRWEVLHVSDVEVERPRKSSEEEPDAFTRDLMAKYSREWDESAHPRGQPENAGEFAPKEGGSGAGEKSAETRTPSGESEAARAQRIKAVLDGIRAMAEKSRQLPDRSPKELPEKNVFAGAISVSEKHHKYMNGLLRELFSGNYSPEETARAADSMHERAIEANNKAFAARFARYANNVDNFLPTDARESPEWGNVKKAFRKFRDRMAESIAEATWIVRSRAEYIQRMPDIGKVLRSDLDRLQDNRSIATRVAAEAAQKLSNATKALYKKFPLEEPLTGNYLYERLDDPDRYARGDAEQYAVQRAPKGGVTIFGKYYQGGRFIPSQVVEAIHEDERKSIEKTNEENKKAGQEKRLSRGKVDTKRLKDLAEQFKEPIKDSQKRRAAGTLKVLLAHHGAATLHRLEEQVHETMRAITNKKHNLKGDQHKRLADRLASLDHMIDLVTQAQEEVGAEPRESAPSGAAQREPAQTGAEPAQTGAEPAQTGAEPAPEVPATPPVAAEMPPEAPQTAQEPFREPEAAPEPPTVNPKAGAQPGAGLSLPNQYLQLAERAEKMGDPASAQICREQAEKAKPAPDLPHAAAEPVSPAVPRPEQPNVVKEPEPTPEPATEEPPPATSTPEEAPLEVKAAPEDPNHALAVRAAAGDEKARDQLINENDKLARYVANQFKGSGINPEDLLQDARIGLIRAADTFKPSKGVKFSSYAVKVMKNTLRKKLGTQGAVRLSRGAQERVSAWRQKQAELANSLGRTPNDQEVADALKWPQDKVNKTLKNLAATRSAQAPVTEEGHSTLEDVADPHTESAVETSDEIKKLNKLLPALPKKHQTVLSMLFGMNGEEERKPKEIAEILNLTTGAISQIKKKALARLRRALGSQYTRQGLALHYERLAQEHEAQGYEGLARLYRAVMESPLAEQYLRLADRAERHGDPASATIYRRAAEAVWG